MYNSDSEHYLPAEELCVKASHPVPLKRLGAADPPSGDAVVVATSREIMLAAALGGLSFGWVLFLEPFAAISTAYLVFVMTLITFIDRRHFVVPDILSLPAIPLGLVTNLALTEPAFWSDSIMNGIAAAALGAGLLLAIRASYSRIRGIEGLGLGDVKLAAAAGAWTGLDGLASTSLLACIAALAAVGLHGMRKSAPALDRMSAVPFGSFIAPAIVIVWLWQALFSA